MTPKQITALRAVSRYSERASHKWASASELCTTPGVMGSLVRAGLVNRTTQSERPIGQRSYSYGWYQINDAGLAALNPPSESQSNG